VHASTHDLTIGVSEVTKRFTSWQRGEADREWEALKALADRAPGLAPRPLRRTVDAGRPVVVMSRLPGLPLGDRPLAPSQVTAVADAMKELHEALPLGELRRLPRRIWHPADAVAMLRAWGAGLPPNLQGDVRRAFVAGAEWIHSAEASRLAVEDDRQVLGQGDGNIANFLWDGERCRLVDFEDAGLSDPDFEIADLVEHLSTWLHGVVAAEELLPLLVSDPAAADRVLQARRVLAFYWLNMLFPGKPAHRRNPPGSCERQARRLLELLA
jgi:Ser/Thr protein kinase RdoA (MazF antagonist)